MRPGYFCSHMWRSAGRLMCEDLPEFSYAIRVVWHKASLGGSPFSSPDFSTRSVTCLYNQTTVESGECGEVGAHVGLR